MPNPAKRTVRVNQILTQRNTRMKRRVNQAWAWPVEKRVARRNRLTQTGDVNGRKVSIPLVNKLRRAGATKREIESLVTQPNALSDEVKVKLVKRGARANFLKRYRRSSPQEISRKFTELVKEVAFLERSIAKQNKLDVAAHEEKIKEGLLPKDAGFNPRTRKFLRIQTKIKWANEQIGLLQRIATHQNQLKSNKR